MQHPKMQYTYVGIDSHKDTHTAVFLDCFFEKLGEITFNNRPSQFGDFLSDADKLRQDGTTLLFGLEDVSKYGRTLTTFLREKEQKVKHVNPLLVSRERRLQSIPQKSDSVDAECAARVLLSKFSELPDAEPEETYWILRTLVIRRNFLVKNNRAIKGSLHNLLTQHYPNYRTYFENLDCNTSLAFFSQYPSPGLLKGTTLEELTEFLREHSHKIFGEPKARHILDSVEKTEVELQGLRDETVRSDIRQLKFNIEEIKRVEVHLTDVFHSLGTTLTSMVGVEVISAAQILSCIGDIRNFSTPAKLARYAGIAPVTYASGRKDRQFANQRGNRELNSLFYQLSQRVTMVVGPSRRVLNPFFHEYYARKMSEGKTRRQALKSVQRRLVNIIWTMLTNNEDYVNPPTFCEPKESENA